MPLLSSKRMIIGTSGTALRPARNIGPSRRTGAADGTCALACDATAHVSASTVVDNFLTFVSSSAGGRDARRNVRVQFADHAAALDGMLDQLELLGAMRVGALVLRDLDEHELEIVE